jgi:hypothetical protein
LKITEAEWVPDGMKYPMLYPRHVKYRLSTIPTTGQMQKPKPVLPTLLPHVNGPLSYPIFTIRITQNERSKK